MQSDHNSCFCITKWALCLYIPTKLYLFCYFTIANIDTVKKNFKNTVTLCYSFAVVYPCFSAKKHVAVERWALKSKSLHNLLMLLSESIHQLLLLHCLPLHFGPKQTVQHTHTNTWPKLFFPFCYLHLFFWIFICDNMKSCCEYLIARPLLYPVFMQTIKNKENSEVQSQLFWTNAYLLSVGHMWMFRYFALKCVSTYFPKHHMISAAYVTSNTCELWKSSKNCRCFWFFCHVAYYKLMEVAVIWSYSSWPHHGFKSL